MSNTYYTQVFTSDGSNKAYNVEADNAAPYVTYNCKNTVNLNFLLREVLFCDPESITVGSDDAFGTNRIHIVPTYNTELDAKSDTGGNRYSDVSTTHGHYYAMRLINALMRTQIDPSEQTTLDTYLKHYGGYKNGLSNGSSNNTSNPNTATMDFAEFFQVALSAVRNKETDAVTTGVNGLVDRENINNAAVNGDLNQRTVDNTSASSLLRTMIGSSKKLKTLTEGQIINDSSDVNWLKQLVYSIIQNTDPAKGGVGASEENERYRSIRRTGITSNEQERFMQLKLRDGDSIVFTFIFNLSNADNTSFNNEQPDSPGTPITVGFRVQHSDTAAEFAASGDNILPIGWTDQYFTGLILSLILGTISEPSGNQTYRDDGIAITKVFPGSQAFGIIKANNTCTLIGTSEAIIPYHINELVTNPTKILFHAVYGAILYGTEGSKKIATWRTSNNNISTITTNIIHDLTDVKDIYYSLDGTGYFFAIHGSTRKVIRWLPGNGGAILSVNDVLKVGGASILDNVIDIYPGYGAFAATVDNLNGTYDIVSFGNNIYGGSFDQLIATTRASGLSLTNKVIQIFAQSLYSFAFYFTDKTMVAWSGTSGENRAATVISWANLTIVAMVGTSDYDGFVAYTDTGAVYTALNGVSSFINPTTAWGTASVTVTKVISNSDSVTALASNGKVHSVSDTRGKTSIPGADGTTYAVSLPGANNNSIIDILSSKNLTLVKKSDNTCIIWGAPKITVPLSNLTGTTKLLASNSSGTYEAIARKSDGSVYGWNLSVTGNGVGNFIRNNISQYLLSNVVDIYLSNEGRNAIALKSDNTVISWGLELYRSNQNTSTTEIVSISTTKNALPSPLAFCAIRSDGSAESWGSLHRGGTVTYPSWTNRDNAVFLSSGIVKVASSQTGFIALNNIGQATIWGHMVAYSANFINDNLIPITVSDIFATSIGYAILKSDGNVFAWADTSGIPISITGISGNAISIVSNSSNFLALTNIGAVVCFGSSVNAGGSTDLALYSNVQTYANSGVTSIHPTNGGFVARKSIDNTAVYWGSSNDNYGIMTGIIDISEISQRSRIMALNKSTSCFLVGAGHFTSTDKNRMQLKPISKIIEFTVSIGIVLNKDNTVDAWGTTVLANLALNSNQLKNELHDIDYISANKYHFVARRSTDNRLFIINHTLFAVTYPFNTKESTSSFIIGSNQKWWYVDNIVKVYSNESNFVCAKLDNSSFTFGDLLDYGGIVPVGFDMSRITSQLLDQESVNNVFTNASMFLKYT
jgi:hypothetical protein